MARKRTVLVGGSFLVVLIALGMTQAMLQRAAAQQGGVEAPRFEVDPFWPKPLPNHWVLGQTIGVWVDDQDIVWIVHRSSATLADNEKALELKTGECCAGAPPVLAFDASGNVVRSWGGPGRGYDWPTGNHGIFIDHTGSVWIGGNGAGDSHILKFSKDGKFLAQYGKPGVHKGPANAEGLSTFAGDSHDQNNFGRVAKIFVDPRANEAYIADGMNDRVYVVRRDTLEVLTSFGDGGRQPGEFFGVHSLATDSKGNVYTTETWEGKRLQKFVFKGVGRVRAPHQGVVWPGTR